MSALLEPNHCHWVCASK